MEIEQQSSIPFLDVLITRSDDNLLTNVYRKKTYTGLLTDFFSFTARSYKLGLVKCMIDRAFKICSSRLEFQKCVDDLSVILQRNQFPFTLIDKMCSEYVDSKSVNNVSNVDVEMDTVTTKYYSIPYVGYFSNIAQKRVQKLISRYCIDLNIRLAFTSFKVGSLFSTKDRLPLFTRSHVVYKFTCASCGACYVGETRRHLNTRIDEHFSNKGSNIYKHLHENPGCLQSYSISDFTILDSAQTDYKLRLKEALHIYLLRPALNVQLHHLDLTLF